MTTLTTKPQIAAPLSLVEYGTAVLTELREMDCAVAVEAIGVHTTGRLIAEDYALGVDSGVCADSLAMKAGLL